MSCAQCALWGDIDRVVSQTLKKRDNEVRGRGPGGGGGGRGAGHTMNIARKGHAPHSSESPRPIKTL